MTEPPLEHAEALSQMVTSPTVQTPTAGGSRAGGPSSWRWTIIFALALALLVLGLAYLWFASGNREVVFLYNHPMGPRVPDTTPFSPVTRSRYWMTGLVAGGAVMVFYASAQWILGRASRSYTPPPWWHVWLLSAGPIAIGVSLITTTLNSPTLPAWLAAFTTLVTLGAVALALQPGTLIARHPLDVLLLGMDGVALALWLTALPGLETMPYWIARGRMLWIRMFVVVLVTGLAGLAVTTAIRRLAHRSPTGLGELTIAGLCGAYLFLPLVHHLVYTDGYFYITDMDNFFARSPSVQLTTWGLSMLLAWGVRRLRRA